MRTGNALRQKRFISWVSLIRISVLIALATIVVVPLFHGTSASLSLRPAVANPQPGAGRGVIGKLPVPGLQGLLPLAFLPQPMVPLMETYEATCTTLQSSFTLGDTVCLKVTGAPLGDPGRPARKVAWVARRGSAVQFDDVTTDPQQFTFTLPTANTTTITDSGGGQVVVDNRGLWKVLLLSTGDGSVADSISFNVNAAVDSVDLAVSQSSGLQASEVETGNSSVFDIYITNNGPSDAVDVELTENVPTNTTFGTLVESTSFGAVCVTPVGSVATCTIASLPKGATAIFNFSYTVDSGVPAGTLITNLVSATSTTAEIDPSDNSSSAEAIVPAASGAETCTLTCRDNFTVTANTTHEGNPGRFVTFTATNVIAGNCGAVTATPASGSFFPVGTTLINVTSETGGGSCSFTVTVTNAPAPTISCPANQNVTAATGQDSASVAVGAPTTVPSSGVTVTGIRSDDDDDFDTPAKPLTDPYPVGITFIDWKVTDATGQSASCQQRITVNAADRENLTISCPANQTVVAPSGTCDAPSINPGTPTTNPSDSNVTVQGTRNDGQALTDPYPSGVTTITWTAVDAINGSFASCQQTITVSGTDTVDPTISVPANVNVTTSSCTATLDDELGVATADDNCSASVNIARTGVPANFVFPTGTTTVTYVATDASGNTATGTQLVTVTEGPAVPPTVAAPADVTLFTGPGATSCGVTVANLDATLGTAAANDNCPGVTVVRSGVPAGNTFPLGNTTVTYIATDRSGNTSSDTQVVTVVDNTAPTITAPADVTLYTGAGATSCSVTASDLNAALGVATADDNCPGETVARSGVPAGNTFPLGNTTVTYTVTDGSGNTASDTQTVTVVDNTPPVVTPPANVTVQLPLNSPATSMPVNYPNPATATDNCPGSINIVYSPASGSTFPVGTTTVTVTATDAHSNSATATFTVTVLYNFTGFFSPIDNLPTVNSMKAGQAAPVKFSLSGNKGLNILAAGSPSSVQVNCASDDPVAPVEETETAGSSSLNYDASSDQYKYVWKTENSWKNTCRILSVSLNDGSVHTAKFTFK